MEVALTILHVIQLQMLLKIQLGEGTILISL